MSSDQPGDGSKLRWERLGIPYPECLEQFLAAFRDDWIKAGQPDPMTTVALVKEIERLRSELSDLSREVTYLRHCGG